MNIRKTNKSITKRLTTIENALKVKLNKFYNNNIKGSILPIEQLRRQYETTVKNLIRKTVQDGYLTGTNLVSEQISNVVTDFVPFISATDIQNIQIVTERVNNKFWQTAAKLHEREHEFIVVPNGDLELKHQFDTLAGIIRTAVFAAYLGFNTAIISKMQLVNNPVALGIGQLEALQIQGEGQLTTQITDLNNLQGQVMFLTREDSIVDPLVCEPLNRTIYDANDPDIPIPIVDTHDHCRCRLIPLIDVTDTFDIINTG